MNKNILVIGGAGYIGSHAMLQLKEKGYNPVCFDNLSTGHRQAVLDAKLIEADLLNKGAISTALKIEKIDAVMHFAANSLVGESVENPLKYYRNNVANAVNLLEAMNEVGVKHIIFSSTAAVYGNPEKIPIEEDDLTHPINPYGRTKLAIEQMLADCDKAYGIKFASLRYFNAAGADSSAKIGELHTCETHLIPLVLQTATKDREKVQIFGTDYKTDDGTCVRDYIHVNDLIDAHILALEYLFSGNPSDIFNLGNGNGFSVREVIEKSKEITGIDFSVVETERRPGDPDTLIASSQKVQKTLQWAPQFADLGQIIQTAWSWHQSQKENPWT